jgi:putative transposase
MLIQQTKRSPPDTIPPDQSHSSRHLQLRHSGAINLENDMKETLAPRDHAEAVALFRAQLIGPLVTAQFRHGELRAELRRLSHRRHVPPGATRSRRFGMSTLERWLYAYKAGGLSALRPRRRVDAGHARALSRAQRQLLCDIRQAHPSASAELIVRTLVADGRLEAGQVSPSTVRRLFREHHLPRLPRKALFCPAARRRWQAERAGHLWHADVCHGPTLHLDGHRTPLRIHAILDDASRYVVALGVFSTEREADMLELTARALRRWGGAPRMLYLDNGSTYSGQMLATACGRLGVTLQHARPHDPQARGKMERFWRTLREGCLDHLGAVARLHDVQVRLLAWLDTHYHQAPHAGLMGKAPDAVWAERDLEPIDAATLGVAMTAHGRRRVRKDGTLSVGGVDWETELGFLAGRIVRIERNLAEPTEPPVLVHEGQRHTLRYVDAKANGQKRRPFSPKPGIDAVAFDPTEALLDRYMGRMPRGDR